jgi:hypothetical protein
LTSAPSSLARRKLINDSNPIPPIFSNRLWRCGPAECDGRFDLCERRNIGKFSLRYQLSRHRHACDCAYDQNDRRADQTPCHRCDGQITLSLAPCDGGANALQPQDSKAPCPIRTGVFQDTVKSPEGQSSPFVIESEESHAQKVLQETRREWR